jgi:hypothetical protein
VRGEKAYVRESGDSIVVSVMRRYLAVLALVVAMCLGAVTIGTASAAPTNDYPSQLATPAAGSVIDPWFIYNRTPASFVAWRLYQNGYWANAAEWTWACLANTTPANCINFPSTISYDNTPSANTAAVWYPDQPVVGADANAGWGFPANAFGNGDGMVAWVDGVNPDGTINIETYGWSYGGNYGTYTVQPPTHFIRVVKTEWVAPLCELFPGTTCPPGTPNLTPPGQDGSTGSTGTSPPKTTHPVAHNAVLRVRIVHRRLTVSVHLLHKSRVVVSFAGPRTNVVRSTRIAAGTHSAVIALPHNLRHGTYHLTLRVICGGHIRTIKLTKTIRV